ncbi:hypothetical protein MBLNU457_g2708t1 [Dothideomycetes sp. NU457]
MDDNAHWMAAGLFSPSKARQQEAQAKDWLYVDEWLRQQYAPRRAPTFERNDDTLQALMSLVAANERADEQRGLVDGLEQAALDEAKESPTDAHYEIYEAIETNMTSDAAAAACSLAKTAVLLNSVTTQPMVMAADLVNVTNRHFALSQQLVCTEALRKTIASERMNIQQLLKEVTGPAFVAPPDLQDKIAEWTRGTKHLKSKLNEYHDRLSASQVVVPQPDIKAVGLKRADTERLHSEVAELNEKLLVFQGLSSTPADAQAEVEHAKAQLKSLMAERDDLFQRLVQR